MTVQAPAADTITKTLYKALGSFWSRIYSDRNLVYRLCQGDSLTAAQTYPDLLEATACLAYNTVPTFHRERWYPVVIRRSELNTGSGVRVAINMPDMGYLGPQPTGTDYIAGSEFEVGGPALPEGYVSYPIRSGSPSGGVAALLSSIVSPKATYTGSEFYVQGDSLILKASLDPFLFPGTFPQLVVQGSDGEPDAEIVLWGANALSDINYVKDMFGYMQDVDTGLVSYQAEMVPAMLSIRGGGTDLVRLRKSIGRVFMTPVTGEAYETVEKVLSLADGSTQVATDTAVYTLRSDEVLLSSVVVGAELAPGSFLADTVRFYNGLDPDRFTQLTGMTLAEFVADVDVLPLGKGMVSSALAPSGLALAWQTADITYHGDDANGHPKLKFDVGADAEYWTAVWAECERRNIDLSELLSDYISASVMGDEGSVVGQINPLRFFMKNCLSVNTSILVVDFSRVPYYIKTLNLLRQFNMAAPAGSVILMTVKYTVTEDDKDLGVDASDTLSAADGVAFTETLGEAGSLEYKDCVVRYKWISRSTL